MYVVNAGHPYKDQMEAFFSLIKHKFEPYKPDQGICLHSFCFILILFMIDIFPFSDSFSMICVDLGGFQFSDRRNSDFSLTSTARPLLKTW